MSEKEKKENEEIIENINKNQLQAEKEYQEAEEARRSEVENALRLPEQRKETAETVDYEELQGNLHHYIGSYMKFRGEIRNMSPSKSFTSLELHLIDEPNHVIIVEFPGPVSNNNGEIVTVYGNIGSVSTKDEGGNHQFVPGLSADIIE
ncbi:hypothetical protein CHH83_14900 [Bacillus sp. 7586-K]|nr:hypothetical protein CHH83_14900 [Bacillus sp. 7586-K]